ncbi:unnamed protein product [Pseudo-nitzschia multistriata]|uniref:PH domain-containing protein n=1 Tax=Pseudo-nitzschia multistriata TaxID=183589 RepID=A0A448ZQU9_9STRA|nr:unnamed protein product [Pseudo-nitzschia multistriata]
MASSRGLPSPPPQPPPAGGTPQSHRIYWQQRWLGGRISGTSRGSSKNLITGSAAVKISPTARARDLNGLLRKTLHLGDPSGDQSSGSGNGDALVLVGTLRSVPAGYVRFEHEEKDLPAVSGGSGEDFHVVRTLAGDEACLSVLSEMEDHLGGRQRAMEEGGGGGRARPTIAPQTRWYYVPSLSGPGAGAGKAAANATANAPVMSSCLELDGYVTSLESDDDSDDCDSSDDDNDNDNDDHHQGSGELSVERAGCDEDLLRRALAPFGDGERDHGSGGSGGAAKNARSERRIAREWRRYLRISQAHAHGSHATVSSDRPTAAANSSSSSSSSSPTLAGYLLKRSARDPHAWKRHYCILTEDDLWCVPRIVRDGERGDAGHGPPVLRTIELARRHGRIRLVDARLLPDRRASGHRGDGFDLVDGRGTTHRFRCRAPGDDQADAWREALSVRCRDAFANALVAHAELILTEETVARTERWRAFVGGEGGRGAASEARSGGGGVPRGALLHFGLDVAEYREGCRQIQALLLSAPSLATARTRRLLGELWADASALLETANGILDRTRRNHGNHGPSAATQGLDTICDHVGYVITRQRRRRKPPARPEGPWALPSSEGGDALACPSGEYPHHQRDPPPIDLFDHLWSELRTLA